MIIPIILFILDELSNFVMPSVNSCRHPPAAKLTFRVEI